MNRGVRTKRRDRVVLVVVERSRLGPVFLAEAYEQVVPIVERSRRTLAQDRVTVLRGEQRVRQGVSGE